MFVVTTDLEEIGVLREGELPDFKGAPMLGVGERVLVVAGVRIWESAATGVDVAC